MCQLLPDNIFLFPTFNQVDCLSRFHVDKDSTEGMPFVVGPVINPNMPISPRGRTTHLLANLKQVDGLTGIILNLEIQELFLADTSRLIFVSCSSNRLVLLEYLSSPEDSYCEDIF